jgi:acyl-CoA reductase-like NAD-dependent aldehyde dehydrogenase
VIVMTNKETLRYLVTEMAGATLSEAEWAQVETQAEVLQTGLRALDALDLSAAEPAVEFDCSEENGHGE